ncbi:DUF6221 family protein [Nocardia sp. CNY236]|uniref:DUF6221 family protein n=1 Tax=Nocardia sp. CNY236 TaxID=1169152 RepID=UPI0004233BE3|nr:DUF6221 family protein [Nocardia sp. CNY236]
MNIADFIVARLEEDENAAQAIDPDHRDWSYDQNSRAIRTAVPGLVAEVGDDNTHAAGHHVARHDPARILRAAYARRYMLALAEVCARGNPNDRMLRCLAAPWSDHPDFQREWEI